MKKIITRCIVLGLVTIVFVVIYAAVQQDYRQSAYDPQIQMAEDAAGSLSTGGNVQQVGALYPQTDFASSLAPFVIIYDQAGNVISATGHMNSVTPTPPLGTLQYAQTQGENRLTWQPQSDVRIATVIVPYHTASTTGFVLAGKNLGEVESRIIQLGYIVFTGWIVSLIGCVILFVIGIV